MKDDTEIFNAAQAKEGNPDLRWHKAYVPLDILAAFGRLASAADADGTSLHVHHCPGSDWLIFFGEADRVVRFGAQAAALDVALFRAVRALLDPTA